MQEFDLKNYNFSRNIVFSGPTGVGKTYKAKEILKRAGEFLNSHEKLMSYIVTDGHFKQMVKSNQLVLRSPEDYQCGLEFYPLEMMCRCGCLLYDDLGVSDVTEAYLRDLTYILDERMIKKVPTIFTTNLNEKELTTKLSERIVSRILHNAIVIVIDGEDKRKSSTEYYFLKK